MGTELFPGHPAGTAAGHEAFRDTVHTGEAGVKRLLGGPCNSKSYREGKNHYIFLLDKNATMGWSLRTSRHRYIEWRPVDLSGDRPVFSEVVYSIELYDYKSDPRERKNVATDSEYAVVIDQHQILFDKLLTHLPTRVYGR